MATANPRKTNGHRRRQVRARVLAEETHCHICGQLVDKTLGKIPGQHTANCRDPDCTGCVWHPKSPVVDEVIPVSRGGSPYERSNCRLAHRDCNRDKWDLTPAEHRARQHATTAPTTTTLVDW